MGVAKLAISAATAPSHVVAEVATMGPHVVVDAISHVGNIWLVC